MRILLEAGVLDNKKCSLPEAKLEMEKGFSVDEHFSPKKPTANVSLRGCGNVFGSGRSATCNYHQMRGREAMTTTHPTFIAEPQGPRDGKIWLKYDAYMQFLGCQYIDLRLGDDFDVVLSRDT